MTSRCYPTTQAVDYRKFKWVQKLPTLSLDIWKQVIESCDDLKTKFTMVSCCKALYYHETTIEQKPILFGKHLFAAWFDQMSDGEYVFQGTVLTHLITDAPVEEFSKLTLYCCNGRSKTPVSLALCPTESIPKTCFMSFRIPKVFCSYIGFTSRDCCMLKFDIDSEHVWGRYDEVDLLEEKPFHTSHISGWRFPGQERTDRTFVLIAGTDKLVFSLPPLELSTPFWEMLQ